MKKKIVLLIILSGLFVPAKVFAIAEESTTGGFPSNYGWDTVELSDGTSVTIDITDEKFNRSVYFLEYPNGYETATEDEIIASNPEELLIYEGTSNSSGEIVLEGWNREGQLRVVEEVPEGYTTTSRESLVDLSNSSTTSFINYKGFVNPNTGRSIVLILIIAILVCLVAISLINKKNNETSKEEKHRRRMKKEKALVLLILPVLSIVSVLSVYNVNAENNNQKNFIITIQDNHGNKMANVEVKIYAKPIVDETSKAIKLSAGEGTFLDGSKEMYFRLPSNECTFHEFLNSLTEEEYNYMHDNWYGSNKGNGYRGLDLYVLENNNIVINSSTTITNNYYEDPNISLIEVDGNGGYIDFYGKRLSSYKVYSELQAEKTVKLFAKTDSYNIGYDVNANCSSFNQYGLLKNDSYYDREIPSKIYACYNAKPDGIYINNYAFIGSDDTCYREANSMVKDDIFGINTVMKEGKYYYPKLESISPIGRVLFENITEEFEPFSISYVYPSNLAFNTPLDPGPGSIEVLADFSKLTNSSKREIIDDDSNIQMMRAKPKQDSVLDPVYGEPISSISIIKNGQEILSISSSEITCTGSGNLDDLNPSYCTVSSSKKQELLNYLRNITNSCKLNLGDFEGTEIEKDR